ncbi:unnamed protein product [Urochloa decumbens]|uniref:FBD domain-containing protein n=1 Tax=Urochloa decumbens TaxID=240449 RepID=A0ABC9D9U1_9POAL
MAQRGGEVAAKRTKLSSGDAGGVGEDRLSALPDDLLVLILLRLDTAAAAVRTSAFSRRWSRVWALLPELRFDPAPDGRALRGILDAPEAAALRRISVTTEGARPESAAAWLPAAARRLSGDLVYHNIAAPPMSYEEEEKEAGEAVQLPCFEKATTIELNMGFLGLALPPQGVFARLTGISLRCVRFRSPCELGDVVSWPRCPLLKKLEVHDSRGLDNLVFIDSKSLLLIKLKALRSLRKLILVTPHLQELSVIRIFLHLDEDPSEPVANISAPQLESLEWNEVYDPQHVHLGNLGQVQWLITNYFVVYGSPRSRIVNRHCLRLLQRFQALYSLVLTLVYKQDINDLQCLMGDIAMLPQIRFLHLTVLNQGHAFGASSFHLLRMCTDLRELSFGLHANGNMDAQSTCPSGCICDQPVSWKTEALVLNHLKRVEIFDMRGAEHEVTFVKQLFIWATVLKKLRIRFNYRVSESKAREFCRALAGSSRPETSVEFYMYDVSTSSTYLLEPEGHGTGF